jgi:hypothetical protein
MLREVGEAYMRFQHLLQSTQELVLVFGRQLFQRPIDVDIKDDRVINELIRLQQLHPSATGVSLIAGREDLHTESSSAADRMDAIAFSSVTSSFAAMLFDVELASVMRSGASRFLKLYLAPHLAAPARTLFSSYVVTTGVFLPFPTALALPGTSDRTFRQMLF